MGYLVCNDLNNPLLMKLVWLYTALALPWLLAVEQDSYCSNTQWFPFAGLPHVIVLASCTISCEAASFMYAEKIYY